MISQKNSFYIKRKNISRNSNPNSINYKSYITKPKNIPNIKQQFSNKVYIKIDPEQFEQNYKNNESKTIQVNDEINTSYNRNILNTINSNNSNMIFKKSFYLRNSNNNSLIRNNINKTINVNNYTIDSYQDKNNDYRKNSPIRKYIEKKNFNFYINSETKGNNISQKMPRVNNTLEYKIINNKYLINNSKKMINNNFKINQNYKNNDIPTLNIYRQKMITIFVNIINKTILKNIKKDINIFFDSLKLNKKESFDYTKKDQKYNEFKDLIYNYVKTNYGSPLGTIFNRPRNGNKLMNSMIAEKEILNQRNNNTLKIQKTFDKKTEKNRFEELQKKYEKIYERKKSASKSSNNFYKRKTNTESKIQNNINKNLNNEIDINKIREKMLTKRKLFLNQLKINKPIIEKLNLNQKMNKSISFNNNDKIFSHKNNIEIKELYKSNGNQTKKNEKKYVLIKKLNISPSFKNYKKYNNKSTNLTKENSYRSINNTSRNLNKSRKIREVYSICNIKDIVTSDKRLYVYINYITLYNKKNEKEKQGKLYDNDLLEISNKINIKYIDSGLNKNKNHQNILSQIEEEIKYKDLEKGLIKLNNYINGLKKQIAKYNINNFGDNKKNNNIFDFKNSKNENKKYFSYNNDVGDKI